MKFLFEDMREEEREHGFCRICGRPLSNRLSLRVGIGPVCRAKLVPITDPALPPSDRAGTELALPLPNMKERGERNQGRGERENPRSSLLAPRSSSE
ncbi:hypothetical protein J7M22_02860 [Candidatus Poribacteria bacterium]|nr:hypothetical protein [Candidatus Poribacteria bacterium]